MAAPKITGEIIGFRQWGVAGVGCSRPSLMPTFAFQECWQPGVNEAVCRPPLPPILSPERRCDEPVSPDCECGLYAVHSPDDLWYRNEGYVTGVVSAWGRVQVHHHGFRAQFARVVALARPDTQALMDVPALVVAAPRLAKRYGVPLVQPDELIAVAGEFGSTVPEDLRPVAPTPLTTTVRTGRKISQTYGACGLVAQAAAATAQAFAVGDPLDGEPEPESTAPDPVARARRYKGYSHIHFTPKHKGGRA